MRLEQVINDIECLDEKAMEKVQRRLDNLTKPLGSLGKLEEIVRRIGGITGDDFPEVNKRMVVIMCADNGVVEEGISSCPKSVTSTVTQNFLKGFTGINVFSKHSSSEIMVVDIGVDDDIESNGIINRKIRKGTSNMLRGSAMTREEAIEAILVGVEIVKDLKIKGYNLIGTGEMGIGNTTTSSAIAAVLTGNKVQEMVGIGSGLTKEAYKHKIDIVQKSIDLNKPDKEDPLDVLSKVGGFDIAGLVGCFLGAAYYKIPIVIDGFISATAALIAIKMNSLVKNYTFPSHGSAEKKKKKIMEEIGFEPFLQLEMRLGEGTGAALVFHIIEMAVIAYKEMGTFNDANIEPYKPLN